MAKVSKRTWTYKGKEKTAYVVRWKVGKTHPSKQFRRQKEADAFRQKVEREIEAGEHVLPADSATIERVCEQFMRLQEDRVRDGRIGYRWHEAMNDAVRLNIVPHLGDRLAKDLTQHDIESLYAKMTRVQDLAPFTAKLRLKVLKSILTYARRRGALKNTEYFDDAMADLRGVEHKEVKTFKVEDIQAILSVVSQPRKKPRANMMVRCYVMLAAFCGLRYGEIGGLSLGDIDYDRGVVHIRHSLQRDDTLKSPKTKAGRRKVPLPGVVMTALRDWIGAYYIRNDRQLVFRQTDGRMQDNNCFRTGNWIVVLQKAGLHTPGHNYHFHALRHFAASWMIENSMNLADVARILGHAKFGMTLRTYTHSVMAEDHQIAVMERGAERLTALNCARIAQEPITI